MKNLGSNNGAETGNQLDSAETAKTGRKEGRKEDETGTYTAAVIGRPA